MAGLAESNVFDLGIQLVITVGALLILAVPLWFSQQRIHEKQTQIYEHVNNVEESERVEGVPAKPTLGSLARETAASVTAGFAHEQSVHEEIKAELRREISALRVELEALRIEVRPNNERPL